MFVKMMAELIIFVDDLKLRDWGLIFLGRHHKYCARKMHVNFLYAGVLET